ncbi:unnamed protein product [Adineta ricciae]|uniref:Peptidase C51 domain-containing protein n=1 Tax=Adineta ricciae TaxID=249248 RepID=A0A814HVM1_ADIRI|nr:unnamed protein product [Adineta ricciae]
MRFLMKLLVLSCLLIVVYQYSQCTELSRASLNSDTSENSLKLQYLQAFKEKRSVSEQQLAPFNAKVGVASSNVPAYSNGNDSYYSGEDSYLYGTYMGLKWQCVEYARRWTFLRKSSVFESVEGANNMWTQLKYVERVADKKQFSLKHHPNGSPTPPTNESYLIYPINKGAPYGHVAVIVDVLPNAIRIAEQNYYFNYWTKNYSRELPVTYRNGLYYVQDISEIYGWMEIDDKKELKPLDEITARRIQMKNAPTLDSNSICSHMNVHIYLFILFLCLCFGYFMFF